MKSFCLLCGKSRCRNLKLCKAKGKVLRAYLKEFPGKERWKVFHAIDHGIINLTDEAKNLLKKEGK